MSQAITQLIERWQSGEKSALDQLTPHVYEELKRLANSYMRRESSGHTLQATALVNEAFIKLAGADVDYASSAHFFTTAARIMRNTLVDHARNKQAQKRGGDLNRQTFVESNLADLHQNSSILELDQCLDKLAELEPGLVKVVELVYFGGLSYDQGAETLGVSRSKFYEDLTFAKTWLKKQLA